ncbi:MAG: GFA family protein [Pseudomonadota bacterium]
MSGDLVTHRGGCHCGTVRFTVRAPADIVVQECNCSLCDRAAFLHLIVPASRFHLAAGESALETYSFNTRVARHLFCRICGVKSFYVPRTNPDGYSVNARCLDDGSVASMTVEPFDGRNWEQHAHTLHGLSAES